MKLKFFQEEFTNLVLSPSATCSLSFRPEGKLNDNEAINVYRNDYEARMIEALGSNFEATWLMLGDDDFFAIGKKYITHYPSTFKSLMHFGHQFPQFLKMEKFDESVVIMAQFESFFWKLFHAKEKDQIVLTQELVTNGTFNLESIGLFQASARIDEIWIHRKDSSSSLEKIDL
ncbi:MAG: DNA-binding domain-containing protein, partial [Bdellovibrionales bacterium]|nr:DNA-binding domain-containing protein [Bdellovibrionales bacterium]